jgi:hypothetical protein
MNGEMKVTKVEVVTPNPNARSSISFNIEAIFTGTLNPARASFTVPVVMQRVDSTMSSTDATSQGDMTFALSAGTAASGVWTASATVAMPPQPTGDHVFSAIAVPDKLFDFSGSWSSAVTGTVHVAP